LVLNTRRLLEKHPPRLDRTGQIACHDQRPAPVDTPGPTVFKTEDRFSSAPSGSRLTGVEVPNKNSEMRDAMKGMVAVALGLSLLATPALAYIGPGAGITVLGALWGVVLAVVLAVAAVLLWPLRILFRRRHKRGRPADASAESEVDARSPTP
jgi:hypothetical protein